MSITPAPMWYAVIAEMKGADCHGQPTCRPNLKQAEAERDRQQKSLGAGWNVSIEEPKVVQQLRTAFNNRRLRQDSAAITTRDLAAAARSLGQRAGVKMGRSAIFDIIERAFMAQETT